MELTLTLDPTSGKPLQVQVFDQVREIILEGKLKAGMALPASRMLAERLGISRNTVNTAYERLAAEGYVKARGTAGVFVEPIPPDSLLLIQRGGQPLYQRSGTPRGRRARPLLCRFSRWWRRSSNHLDFWVGRSAASRLSPPCLAPYRQAKLLSRGNPSISRTTAIRPDYRNCGKPSPITSEEPAASR